MHGLFFLLFNLGVVLVAHWCLRNDSTSLDGATNGLFAMTKPVQGLAPAPKKKLASPNLRAPRLPGR